MVSVVIHRRQYVVEAVEPFLGTLPVALDPLGHQVEDLRLEMHRSSLTIAAA